MTAPHVTRPSPYRFLLIVLAVLVLLLALGAVLAYPTSTTHGSHSSPPAAENPVAR